jgi:3-methylcrotonyl-CoA carboxylase beta subunit
VAAPGRLSKLTAELRQLEEQLRQGGGPERIERQHRQGKLTARERISLLLDPQTSLLELGLLVAYDQYDGQAAGAGVVTGVGQVHARPVVIVANDATVKAGSWWPETITKMLRAQEVAMRCRVPIIYLVDSAGVNLPYQGGVFPGQYGASRIFFYNSVMRRYLGVPQLAAVMGPCIAGGAYLPALSDVILMVEGTSFMGLGGPNLVKGATGQTVDGEVLGGAYTHNAISGVAHYRVPDDSACVARLRELLGELPYSPPAGYRLDLEAMREPATESVLYDIIPDDHRQPYDMHALLQPLLDDGHLDEFQQDFAPELICGTARICGVPVGVLANARAMIRPAGGGAPRFGGIIYADSAEKAAYFIETMSRHRTPLLFVQDVSGFMVGTEAEHSGIIRAGARFVEAMATATVPKVVLTVNHASGAGYYAMAGQGFDPDFIFTWPTGRMGVMEGDSAVMALFGAHLEELKQQKQQPDEALQKRMAAVRADYEHQLDARFAAARGFVDAVIAPEDTRVTLAAALWTALHNPGPHIGPFGLWEAESGAAAAERKAGGPE